MDSPRSGYRDEPAQLLYVRTNVFDLFLQGKPFHPTVETLHLHRDEEGKRVEALLDVRSHSNALTVEKVEIFSPDHDRLMPQAEVSPYPCFYETQSYQLVIRSREGNQDSISFYHDNVNLRKAVKPLPNSDILTGTLNFQNEVGYTDLEVRVNGETALVIRLEVFPTKLDYKNDYANILEDVNRQIYNLSFDFLRKTYHLTGLKDTQHQSLTEFWTILQHVFEQLVHAIERIQRAPHHRLTKELHITEAAKVKKAGRENIRYLAHNPHQLQSDPAGALHINGQSYRPAKLVETKRRLDYDTAENRFLRWMLERIGTKLKAIQQKTTRGFHQTPDPELQRRIVLMQRQLQRLVRMDFLEETGGMERMSVSLVLQMAPGYREAYRIYLMLMKGLSIQSDLFHLSMKDLAQLYEYWCFLKIHDLLSRKYKLLQQDIIRVDRRGLFVTLDRSRAARMTYENPRNGERFTLYYNALPLEEQNAGFPTLGQRPDTVLHLIKQDAGREQQDVKFVFDAKYRLNPAYEGTSYYRSYGAPGPEEDDINTMHRYRDAIVYRDRESGKDYERSMFGAYVLFPYGNQEQFREHRFYKSIELVNVGAIPLLPGSTELMEDFLDELILDSPEKAFERSTQPKGTPSYYKNKFMGRNVLIGSLRTGQLEIALKDCFYHMPIDNLQDHKLLTQLEYIALYQSRKQHGDKAGIRYYGRIAEWRVVKRGDIRERSARPGTEQRIYVYFRIESWEKREPAIELGGQSIYTCLSTTKYMFDRAVEIAELRLETEEQLADWREKRRLGRVKVELDREHVDLAERVKWIQVDE